MSPPTISRKTWTDRAWTACLLLVVGVAAFLRFDGIAEPSLWLDEILHVGQAQKAAAEAANGPWHAWLTGLSVDRENGPLYYAGQLLAMRFLDREMAVRLMPALAGVAAVLALCFVGACATGSRWSGLAAGLLLATSPLHVYYSREGRPYAAVMLGAVLLLLLALRQRSRWARVAAYPVALAAAYLGAVAAPLLVACCGLACLSWWWTRRRGVEASSGLGHLALASGLALLVLPLLFPQVEGLDTASGQQVEASEHSEDVSITRPLSARAFDRLAASLTVSGVDAGTTSGLSWLFFALAAWGVVVLLRRDPSSRLSSSALSSSGLSSSGLWVVGLCVLPIIGWMFLLQVFDHWYNVRYTSSGLPAFLVLVAAGVTDVATRAGALARCRRQLVRGGTAFALLAFLLLPSWRTARAEPWQKPPWRDVANLLGTLAVEGEIVVARDEWSRVCVGYYLDRLGHRVPLIAADFHEDRARAAIESSTGAFVVAAGYRKGKWLRDWLGSLDPVLSRPEANLRVYYAPDFTTLFSARREARALPILERLGHSVASQEFTGDPLLLGEGWAGGETAPDGTTFRWATSQGAEIAVAGPAGPRRQLHMRLRPFPSPNLPPQRLRVTINGELAGEMELAAGWNEPALTYTSDRTFDLVRFEFDWLQSPREANTSSKDRRRLAAAFDRAGSVGVE